MFPVILAALGVFATRWIYKLLIVFGVSFVVYQGMDVALTGLVDALKGHFNDMPASLVQILSIAGMDEGITIIFSAYASALAIKAAVSAKKLIFS